MRTEYKVFPAPERARKVRGLKGPALFAHEVETIMNELAADGWQYLRTDTLPHEERSGLTNKVTTYRNLLVFHRIIADDTAEDTAEHAATPAPTPPPPTVAEQPEEIEEEVLNLWEVLNVGDDKSGPSGPDRQR